MIFYEILKNYKIILASKSPRRHQLLKELHIPFEIRNSDIDENYPRELKSHEITNYIAQKKADSLIKTLSPNEILITADTLVWAEGKALGKPQNYAQGVDLLTLLSGKTHQVITSVCLRTTFSEILFHEVTEVTFKDLTNEEINFYLTHYHPYDKAGAYGIQEWIGYIGIDKINGSYNNVVGLPTHRLFKELKKIINNGSSI